MFRKLTFLPWLSCGIFLLLGACGPQPPAPTAVSPLNLAGYATQTPASYPSPSLPPTEIPSPTPTPHLYTLKTGDTLGRIAERWGISLEALQSANPGVEATRLTVGQALVIPAEGASPPPVAFPATPVPLEPGPVHCYPAPAGTDCLGSIQNPNPAAVENLQIEISLLNENGQVLNTQAAFLPLNQLPSGQNLPFLAHFPAAVPGPALAQLKTATFVRADDPRYLPSLLDNLLISLAWDKRSALVTGLVSLPPGSPAAQSLWLAASAYDSTGQPVGLRRWEWSGNLPAGQALPFSFRIYSLGPEIERVETQVEARP